MMRSIHRHIFLVCLLACIQPRVMMGQAPPAGEKIFVYTDKPAYLSGEVIWYKVCVRKDPGNNISDLSNAVYAELLDSAGTIFHSKLLLKRGSCGGAFELSGELPSGVYVLKVYSSNMRSVSPKLYFQRKIPVVNYRVNASGASLAWTDPEVANDMLKALQIRVHADQPSYFKREKVSVDLAIKGDDHQTGPVDIVVSVYSLDSLASRDRGIAVQVQNAFAPDIRYANAPAFYGRAEENYMLDDYTRFNTLGEVFREYVKGAGMGLSNRRNRLFIYDDVTRMPFQENAFVILDGMPVSDIGRLMEVDPRRIKKIEVVTRKYFFGRDVYYGIISLQSYNGDMAGYEPDSGIPTASYEALRPQRIFDHPLYGTAQLKASRHPDFRSTLYWKPDVQADDNGKAHFEFYTSDISGRFLLVVHAMAANGAMGSASAIINVK